MTAASVQLLYAPDMQISGLRTAETVILVTLRLRALRWRALGVESLLPSLALDLVQRAEEPQRLFGDVAATIGVQIVELAPRVSHTSHFNHTLGYRAIPMTT
jgi:hypothetical protein